MTLNPYAQNLEQEVMSADPVRLVLLLLRGARQATEEARQALRRGEIHPRAAAVSKAVERVAELCRSLDHEKGGEVARNLAALYDYMIHRLNEANMTQTEAPLAEVSGLLVPLIEAWSELESSSMPAMVGAEEYAGAPMDCVA